MFSYESVGLVLVYYIMLNVLNVFYCRLLDLACHDNNQSVQVNAILALRTLSQQDELKKVTNTENLSKPNPFGTEECV
jgi:hypothetical protein